MNRARSGFRWRLRSFDQAERRLQILDSATCLEDLAALLLDHGAAQLGALFRGQLPVLTGLAQQVDPSFGYADICLYMQ